MVDAVRDCSGPNNSKVDKFHRIDAYRFIGKVGLLGVLLFGAGYIALVTSDLPRLIAQVAIGTLLAHGTALAHQASHRLGTGDRRIDHAIGKALCWTTLLSFRWFQWKHLRHHRFTGTGNDKASFDTGYHKLGAPSRLTRLFGLALHLFKPNHYLSAGRRLRLALSGELGRYLVSRHSGLPKSVARKIQQEYVIMSALILVIVSVSFVARTDFFVTVWAIPLLIAWGPVHALNEITKHWDCDSMSPDVMQNTRSLRAGWFGRWLTNHNNAHIGHHLDSRIPMDKLEKYESLVAAQVSDRFCTETYPSFFGRFFLTIWSGPEHRR